MYKTIYCTLAASLALLGAGIGHWQNSHVPMECPSFGALLRNKQHFELSHWSVFFIIHAPNLLKNIYIFPEPLESHLQASYPLTHKYVSVQFLTTRTFSFVTTVHLSKLGNATLIQYCDLICFIIKFCQLFQECPKSPPPSGLHPRLTLTLPLPHSPPPPPPGCSWQVQARAPLILDLHFPLIFLWLESGWAFVAGVQQTWCCHRLSLYRGTCCPFVPLLVMLSLIID